MAHFSNENAWECQYNRYPVASVRYGEIHSFKSTSISSPKSLIKHCTIGKVTSELVRQVFASMGSHADQNC